MPKRKKTSSPQPSAKKNTGSQAKPPTPSAEEEQFVNDVLTRGEAAVPDEKGKLPAGATHEIVDQEPGKLPQIKRARFSITG